MTRTTSRYRCAEPNCREIGFFDYSTKASQREDARRKARNPWRCTRHTTPESVMGADNMTQTVTLTAERSKRFPDLTDLFWREAGRDDVGSGFAFGPGFKAWAKDFPEGTRLVITARIEQPASEDDR